MKLPAAGCILYSASSMVTLHPQLVATRDTRSVGICRLCACCISHVSYNMRGSGSVCVCGPCGAITHSHSCFCYLPWRCQSTHCKMASCGSGAVINKRNQLHIKHFCAFFSWGSSSRLLPHEPRVQLEVRPSSMWKKKRIMAAHISAAHCRERMIQLVTMTLCCCYFCWFLALVVVFISCIKTLWCLVLIW